MTETILIRNGEVADVPKAVDVVNSFVKEMFAESGIKLESNVALEEFKKYAEYSEVAFDGEKMIGLIAGMVSEIGVSNDLMFQEKVWYVLPEHRSGVGRKLLKTMEDRLVKSGVKYSMMAHLGEIKSSAIERFYKSNGYRVAETHYIKNL